MPKRQDCAKHCETLQYSKELKDWICPKCLYGSFLTAEAQKEATKRYLQSGKGKVSTQKYEQSEGGKVARDRYLKSEKYKQRRREYNQRQKDSLAIARQARQATPTVPVEIEMLSTDEMLALIQELQKHVETQGTPPTPEAVRQWAIDNFGIPLSLERASELINRTMARLKR